ncbi:MAG TPA: hypothetical protein VM122_08050 [Usitatibacter sp.]|nr:hypothetical protein [Usitatibacter sp.]
MSTPGDDAQREMEQRALRNVRGLVDKIETDDQLAKRSQVRTLIGLVLGAVIVAVLLGLAVAWRDRGREVVITPPPPKPGQVMPQGPRAPQ